ncbi:MAG: SurA N-terminal domain-containing protein [Candidatus Competibacteraceae bacterium]
MLQTIRDRATGWIAYIIVGLLVITFALWGIQTYFSQPESRDIAKVGGNSISPHVFQQAFQQQRQRFPQLDPTLLKNSVLQGLINEEILQQVANEQTLRIGDRQLGQAIYSIPLFQQDGKFDVGRYEQFLRSQGYPSKAAFEEYLRHNLMREQLRNGLLNSAIVTAAELNNAIALLNQQRELQYLLLPLNNYLQKASVDEDAISRYFQEHQAQFQKPEQVQVEYLEVKLDTIADKLTPGDDELQQLYQEQKAKYTQPEERNASHILVTLPANADAAAIDQARERAKAIHAEIAGGAKTFDQALQDARKESDVQGGELGTISRGMYKDPGFEDALFALPTVGAVSEPVQTSFGFHIIRLDGLNPEKISSFAEVRDNLAKEWRLQQAETRFYDLSEKLNNAIYEHPDSLEPAARAVDLAIDESPWFTRQGGEGIAGFRPVAEAAFSDSVLKQGANSELLEVEPNHLVVLRLKDHREATPLALAEVHEQIATEVRKQQAKAMLEKDLATVRQRAEQGESLEALAKEFGGEWKNPGLIGRRDSQLDTQVLQDAFRLPPPAAKPTLGTAQLAAGDQAVLAISRVVPGDAEKMPEAERKALAQQLTTQTGATELEGFLQSLRQRIPIVVHQDKL